MKDNGYDVKDYMNVDEKFGNLEDFKVKDARRSKI
jgi:glycosidase